MNKLIEESNLEVFDTFDLYREDADRRFYETIRKIEADLNKTKKQSQSKNK